MKIDFWLLDINHEVIDARPEIRLWGIDSKGRRVLVRDRSFRPYFYLLVEDETAINRIADQIAKEKSQYPDVEKIEVLEKRFFGKKVKAIRIVCRDTEVITKYAESMEKIKGVKDHVEDDLRPPFRYIVDNDLRPCGWHRVDVRETSERMNVQVDGVFDAVGAPKPIDRVDIPALRMLAFSIVCFSQRGAPKPSRNPIVIISTCTTGGKEKQFVADDSNDSKVVSNFVKYVEQYDPDVIAGYGSNKFDWPYLLERSKLMGTKLTIDRIRSGPHTSLYGHVSVTGRANFDLFDLAEDIPEVKVKSLENLADFLGVVKRKERTLIDETELSTYWVDDKKRRTLLKFSIETSRSILGIASRMLEFAMQLASLTGLPLDHVGAAAVGFRVDWYLIKQAYKLGELIPRRVEQFYLPYRGAIVLPPKPGIHDEVAVLDFTAMYPNLMIMHNLSPDTFIRPDESPPNEITVVPEVNHRFRKEPPGFYKTVLSSLIDVRERIRKQLRKLDPKTIEYTILKEREKAVKVITNATYGYAGWVGARWYVREVAESAAAFGRVTIQELIETAGKMGLEVIYSDTDAIFVKYDPSKTSLLLKWVRDELNMEMRPDKIYERILFTEAKKRYAGLLPDGTLDIVGMEVVRGDWANVAKNVQEKVLELVLKERSPKRAIEFVRRYIRDLREGRFELIDFIIWKTLTKPVEEYEVRAPHVEVAKKLLKEGWELTLGDKVGYVITKGPGKLFEKAKPYSMVSADELDLEYYVSNQIMPAALRVLEVFGVPEEQLLEKEKPGSLADYLR